jgi:histone chaperone ASF1
VNNDYGDPELRETQPPSAPQFDKLQRNILATNPRVTRFKVWLFDWFSPEGSIFVLYISMYEEQYIVSHISIGQWNV